MLTLDVTLLGGRYEAAGIDSTTGEWPPHPARAFCALVAGARDEEDWAALRWLEQQSAPDVLADAQATTVHRSSYVVTNRRENAGGSQFHPGRSNALKHRAASQPATDVVRFEWAGAEPSSAVLATLDRLALRVPYLGRSTGHVIAEFRADSPPLAGLARFAPCSQDRAESLLRVPHPGYVDQLREAYDDQRPSAELSRTMGYAVHSGEMPLAVAGSPFDDLIMLRFAGIRADGELAPLLTAALRRSLLARVPDPLPAALHGHDLPGQPHVAYLPLADVGHKNARGRLLGLGVALPILPPDDRRRIIRAAVGDPPDFAWTMSVPGLGSIDLAYVSDPDAARTLTPSRWRDAHRVWATVTPVAYDRYPKSDAAWIDEIVRSCAVAGYPEPSAVKISTEGMLHGSIRLRTRDLPERLRSRILRHVELTFDRPVPGPVLIGAGRYLGIGVFAPRERP